jgi:hypothetical protein
MINVLSSFTQTCYAGGVGAYAAEIRSKLQGFQGFETVKA